MIGRAAIRRSVLAGACLALLAHPAMAAADCRSEISAAARRHGVPESVALAVGKVESSHHPLAMNIAGWPARARSAPDGVIAVRKLNSAGIRSIDVGCMQINLKHHPAAFASLDDAFDPAANAEYGVSFLKRLYQEKRSWGRAIAAYHSGDPAEQSLYLRLIRDSLMRLPPEVRTASRD